MVSHCCPAPQNVMTWHNSNLIICRGSCLCQFLCLFACLCLCASPCDFSMCGWDSLEPDSFTTGFLHSGSGPQSRCYISEGSNFFSFFPPLFLTQPRKLCIILATLCSLQEIQGERNQTLLFDGDSKEERGAIFLDQAVASYQKGIQARNIAATTSGKCYVLHVYNF